LKSKLKKYSIEMVLYSYRFFGNWNIRISGF